jgi:hypothetical protein
MLSAEGFQVYPLTSPCPPLARGEGIQILRFFLLFVSFSISIVFSRRRKKMSMHIKNSVCIPSPFYQERAG